MVLREEVCGDAAGGISGSTENTTPFRFQDYNWERSGRDVAEADGRVLQAYKPGTPFFPMRLLP